MGQVVSRELEQQLRKELQEQLLSLPQWILQQHFSHELAGRLERVTELSSTATPPWQEFSTDAGDDALVAAAHRAQHNRGDGPAPRALASVLFNDAARTTTTATTCVPASA